MIGDVIRSFQSRCSCGLVHRTAVRDVRVGSGLVHQVGKILKENGFPRELLLVADENTLRAAEGIFESLDGFSVTCHIWKNLRVATVHEAQEIQELIHDKEIGVLSVGTGSVNDPCRLACSREKKPLCIFATAPSMDGFASYGAPLVKDGFKSTYAAESPAVVVGDTAILAAAPVALKSAGFGDMIAKYVGLVDWKISSILIGECYCERVAELTRNAVDNLVKMADRVTANDEETAGKIFEALLMTGIGMSFMQNSRPASGSEHIVAHLIECKELPLGIIPNYHGEDVGVCTLEMLERYEKLASYEKIHAHREKVDWEDVRHWFGPMADEVMKLNMPTTVADEVDPRMLEEKWQDIREIIRSVPFASVCRDAMRRAGCKLTVADIGKSPDFFSACVRYSPYMRRRLTLLRIAGMIEEG